jgi:hypothetical protein
VHALCIFSLHIKVRVNLDLNGLASHLYDACRELAAQAVKDHELTAGLKPQDLHVFDRSLGQIDRGRFNERLGAENSWHRIRDRGAERVLWADVDVYF